MFFFFIGSRARNPRPSLFFFNDTAPTEIYTTTDTLSLHDALPIYVGPARRPDGPWAAPAALRAPVTGPDVPLLLPRDPHQLGVDPGPLLVPHTMPLIVSDEQVVEPVAGHHVLPQRHRPVLLDDH